MKFKGLWKWIKGYLIALFGCAVMFAAWPTQAQAYDQIGGYPSDDSYNQNWTVVAKYGNIIKGAMRIYGTNDEMVCGMRVWVWEGQSHTNTSTITIALKQVVAGNDPDSGTSLTEWSTSSKAFPINQNPQNQDGVYLQLPLCPTLWHKSIPNVEYWLTFDDTETSLNYQMMAFNSSTAAGYNTVAQNISGTWYYGTGIQPLIKYGFINTGLTLDTYPEEFDNATSTSFVDPDFGTLGNYIYRALKYLFYPTQNQMDKLEEKKDALIYKVPWGYIRLLRVEFNVLDTANTSTHWKLDFKGYDGNATATIDITQSYLDVPQAARDLAETWLIRIMWLWFVLYVIYRATDSLNSL